MDVWYTMYLERGWLCFRDSKFMYFIIDIIWILAALQDIYYVGGE